MNYATFTSPFGKIVISTDGKKITGFYFLGQKYFKSIPSAWKKDIKHPLLIEAIKQVKAYFKRDRKDFDLPIITEGSAFQKKVWAAVAQTPYGVLTTYRSIAETIGKPKAVRAVGSAIGRNPICVIVPCHRVVGTNGAMSGYAGGIDRKKQLLVLEGSYIKPE